MSNHKNETFWYNKIGIISNPLTGKITICLRIDQAIK